MFCALIVVIIAVLTILNAKIIAVDYYLGVWQCPLPLLIFYVFLSGALFGFIGGLWLYLRAKHENLDLREQLTDLR
jgi:uncharacterized integral membrane protein